MKKITLALLSIALLLGSCSIENRHYLPGYFVQWNKNKKEIKQKSNEPQITTTDFTDKQINKEKSIESDNSTVNNNTSENNLKESDVLIASTNDKQIIIPKTESFSFTNKQTTTIALDKPSDNKKNEQKITSSKKKESKNKSERNDTNGSGKSQVIALILCILVGVLGIHRFYLGYTGIGILMLLTGGVCGILALIDLIRIITGDLKPKGGDYSEKL